MSFLLPLRQEEWPRVQDAWGGQMEHSLYIIEEEESGLVKIGHATHPTRRLSALQGGNPRRLKFCSIFVAPRHVCFDLEQRVLRTFKTRIARGEWLAVPCIEVTEYLWQFTEPSPEHAA